jgi:hypothetical protein
VAFFHRHILLNIINTLTTLSIQLDYAIILCVILALLFIAHNLGLCAFSTLCTSGANMGTSEYCRELS